MEDGVNIMDVSVQASEVEHELIMIDEVGLPVLSAQHQIQETLDSGSTVNRIQGHALEMTVASMGGNCCFVLVVSFYRYSPVSPVSIQNRVDAQMF